MSVPRTHKLNSITKETAKKLFEAKFWESMSAQQRFEFQISTDLLCMPFGVFHKAAEDALGRSVWSHEFATPESLWQEYNKEKPRPSMEDIVNLIPPDKRVLVVL